MPNLSHLLDSSKILPVYLSRSNVDKTILPPWSVEIHPTSNCNYACVHCSYGHRNKAHKTLEENVARQLIQDLTGPCKPAGVYFSGGGEPLTFPHVREYLRTLRQAGVDTALISNGALLKVSDTELFGGAGYMAISVYSVDEGEYSRITSGNNFERQFGVPAMFDSGMEKPRQIGARCVLNNINYKNILNIYNKAIESGFDYIIFIPAVDYEGSNIGLTDDARNYLMALLENEAGFDSSKTNIASLIKKKFAYYLPRLREHKVGAGCECLAVRTNAFVNYDGGIYTCQPHIGQEQYCLGNLYRNSFAEIWNGERHKEVISRLNWQWDEGLCKNCRCISYNYQIQDYRNLPANEPVSIIKDNFL